MTDHDVNEQYHAPPGLGKYLVVCGLLLILTAISFVIGNTPWIMRTPSVGWTGMMTVSCAKAMLVILFFMHLKWEANWKYVLTIPASMMSVFLLLMLVPDIGLRTDNYSQVRWLHSATPGAADDGDEGEIEEVHGTDTGATEADDTEADEPKTSGTGHPS